MKMFPAEAISYPRFAAYVKDALPMVVNSAVIIRAMEEIGQLNRAKLITALSWGSNPQIKVVHMPGKDGEFSPDIGSNEIRISRSLVQAYEDGNVVQMAPDGTTPLVGVTLLHELVHWGDDQDGIDRPGEEGDEFERAVWGAAWR